MLDGIKKIEKAGKDLIVKTVTNLADLNNDGVVDEKDLKIATDSIKSAAHKTASATSEVIKDASKSEIVKEAAAGALVGGAIAAVVPVVGVPAGAVVGAVLGAKKAFSDKK